MATRQGGTDPERPGGVGGETSEVAPDDYSPDEPGDRERPGRIGTNRHALPSFTPARPFTAPTDRGGGRAVAPA